jgi:hypothetical protein
LVLGGRALTNKQGQNHAGSHGGKSRRQAEQKAKLPAKQSITRKPVTTPPKPSTGQQRN